MSITQIEQNRQNPRQKLWRRSAQALVEARTQAGMTQAELAARMKTTQSAVARLESGRVPPSTRTLERVARATGTRLRIQFDPA